MKCSVKLYVLVIVGIIFVGFMLINNGLFKSNEGMDNNSSASAPTKKEEAAKNAINKLKSELEKLTPELEANKKKVNDIQKKNDLLMNQIQVKQSEIDKLQNKIDVDNMSKTV